jgi:transposase
MMTRNKKDGNFQSEIINIDDLVTKNHILRIIEREFDFNFIYDYVEELYSPLGRPSIDPVVLFKCHFLKVYYGLSSLRRTYEDIKYHALYKWFLGYGMNEETPNYSTYSKNYTRKFRKLEEDLLETFFYKVLKLLGDKGVLDLSNIFIDSTHTKANANKKKVSKQMVNIIASEYKEELEAEIRHAKFNLKENDSLDESKEIINDEECNHELNIEKTIETKEILKSDIDSEAGILYKDEKEKMVAYNTSIICDNNNYVLSYDTNPSNMHDSKSFYPTYQKFKDRFGVDKTDYMAGDAAYITTHICKTIIEDNIKLCLPYKRPMTKKGYFKKYEFTYDEHNDIYICPNNKDLLPTTVDKNGYIKYTSSRKDCRDCPFKEKCTASATKIVPRHVWEKYKEIVMDDYRHSYDCREVYASRPEHVERIFADGKGKHGLRYTLFRGKRRVSSKIGLIFACTNLKKYATHVKLTEEFDSSFAVM